MFAATVVAMPSQDDSHIPARRSFASQRGRVTSQGAASAGPRAVSAGMTRALSRGCKDVPAPAPTGWLRRQP